MIKKNIQIVLFPQMKKDGTKPIKIRTTIKRKVQYENLGISVLDNQWDTKKLRVKSNHPDYKLYNEIIENGLKKLYGLEHYQITSNINEDYLYTPIGQIISSRIKYEKSKNRISTEKKLTTALHHLTCAKYEKIPFCNFNLEKIKDFHSYLFTIGGIQESSMGSYHRVIRSSLKLYATEKEISHKIWSDPYANFKTTRKSKIKLALRGSQVIQLEDYILFNKRKEGDKFNSTCMFLFSIYSFGTRFGDIFSLKWENIIDGVIRFETEKNQRKINIKLNPKLYNILKYYTPLKEFYKNPFEYKSLNFEETEKWYPNINGLIQSELDYINFRIEHTPKEFRIINELFQHFPEKVLFQEFNEDIKGELELIIKTRDYYIENFINSYSKRTKGPLFPYFKNGETDVRKIKNRKESSNAIVNKSLKLVSRECNITPISFHEARHTFAYHARRNGFDVFLLSRALGHSSIAITQNYLNDFDNEEIMEKNEILIDGLNNYYLI